MKAIVLGQEAGYYELRIYTVSSNKMDGVLERFRETVEPVRQKHAIRTIGYWTAPGTTNGGTFVYLLTAPNREVLQKQEKEFGDDPQFKEGYAASNNKHGKTVDKILSIPLLVEPSAQIDFTSNPKPRGFALRIYSVAPGKLVAFRNRWRDFAAPIYKRHGLRCLAWWVAEKKDEEGNDQFVCLLACESVETIQTSIVAFHQDPEWQLVEKESERGGKLRLKVTEYKMAPTDFSGLK